MCGRYTLRTPLNVLAEQFLFDVGQAQAAPRYNIPPTTEVLAVRHPRELAKFRWGLIPVWAKDAKIAYSTINAVATKPDFRTAFKKRRCLVLADGYFEWLKKGKGKQRYLYEVDGGRPFAFAGLWEWMRAANTGMSRRRATSTASWLFDRRTYRKTPAL